ncbi:tRNA dimethylallyltransferase MiaA [Alteracholeplasma palmae J233]|uniref:tRNA dimethylallyltransferase n=1 Tax=Alteracholeplasma palmae (strain ATCC 49389 / J233) TaxID=1318466 RepID=U4KKU5_ALTPJ|nr:tRNA (adenosine(37)-N6)-dimethylallyltransferase MiaA [Alteracholeplasma palmae]CCV64298.1 tRNA dimethylallyltransferase MiaA [Alteracholeplasma palmae J233]
MKKVIVITGPTASGKTKLSIDLAKKYHAEIINGDSVQVYKEFNIGSAKITETEKEGITHHLLDLIEPEDTYSIYQFQTDVRKLIDSIKLPMIVGGSGLYIKSALYQYELTDNQIGSAKAMSDLDIEETYLKLKELDPNTTVDKNNPQRVLRAYNDALTGKLRSEKNGKNIPLYDILILYLNIPRDTLRQRVTLRLDMMLENNFIDEVKTIKEKYPNANLNVIGYREINDYLENRITLETARQTIITKTMQFAKRQKTWVKNQMSPIILEALDEKLLEKASAHIDDFLRS